MSRHRFLTSVRLLAQSYQAFERLSGRHVRELGLTPAQFDIVATLGNQPGMSFRELGQRTLITKGTLTGVVARMRAMGTVQTLPNPDDGRSELVSLTPQGQALFERVFPAHVDHCAQAFSDWSAQDFARLDEGLRRVHTSLERAQSARAGEPRTHQE